MALAGACYLINGVMMILSPSLASITMLVPAFIGELSFALWLAVRGVNEARWNEHGRASGVGTSH